MTTNYDPIAEQYKRAKQQPWRAHVETFTLMKLIDDPTGKAVIDIACGEGFYTRMIRRRGAAKVTGVDRSETMIGLARASEAQQRLGIDYIVGDGRDIGLAADYDLAIAAYFLNYAHDPAELDAMCRGIARCLKPGGRFVNSERQSGMRFSRSAVLPQIWIRNFRCRPDPRRGANYLDVLPGRQPFQYRELLSQCRGA
jgi:SAM-dependent methyltransferase